jgi:hypothetical protein
MAQLAISKRGSVAPMVGLAAVPLITIVGLPIDLARMWLVQSRLQMSLDAAALTMARELPTGGNASDGLNLFWANFAGYLGATATAPVVQTPAPGGAGSVQLTGSATVIPKLLAIIGIGSVRVSGTSIAQSGYRACALTLDQSLSFTGNARVAAPGCALASNDTDASRSIDCGGSSSVTAAALVASGGINGCPAPNAAFQLPTVDPFAAIQNVAMPPTAASTSTCQDWPATVTTSNTYEGGGKMFCDATFGSGHNKTEFKGDLTLTSGGTINLVPGTYIFYNSSVSLQSGTLQCTGCTPGGAGVTIILTGSPAGSIGTLNINGTATVTLNAPSANAFNPAFNGMLFYMDKNATNHGSTPVQINGGSNTVLTGGMYFPSVAVKYSGNTVGGGSLSACLEIVGSSITFTGDSDMDISGCGNVGTHTSLAQSVRLVR